jgi:PhnB protein
VSTTPAQDVTGLQVNLFCEDIEAAMRFYVALGFPVIFTAPANGAAEHIEVDAAGTRIGLTSVEAANRIAGLGVVAQAPANMELVLWCTDADRMHRRALAAGATEITAPQDSPDGRIRYGWVRDPAAHQVKFVAPR